MLSGDAATLHRLTQHGSALDAADRRRLVAFRPLDLGNRPAPFKRYVTRKPVPFTREFGLSSARAADVLSVTAIPTIWPMIGLESKWSIPPLFCLNAS